MWSRRFAAAFRLARIQRLWRSVTGFFMMQRDNNASVAMGYIWCDGETARDEKRKEKREDNRAKQEKGPLSTGDGNRK